MAVVLIDGVRSDDNTGMVFTASVAEQTSSDFLDLDDGVWRSTGIDRILHVQSVESTHNDKRSFNRLWRLRDITYRWSDVNRQLGETRANCRLGVDRVCRAAVRMAFFLLPILFSSVNDTKNYHRDCVGDGSSNAV